jgi:hypothetical protein
VVLLTIFRFPEGEIEVTAVQVIEVKVFKLALLRGRRPRFFPIELPISQIQAAATGKGFAKIQLVKLAFLHDCMGRFREEIDVYRNLYCDCNAV